QLLSSSMDTRSPGSSGLLGSLRDFADGLLGSLHDRVELFSVELQEEKLRFVQTLIWVAAVVATGLLALVFGSLVLLAIFWETARVPVTIALALVYALVCA